MESVAWAPALIVLALGAAAGAVLAWRLRGQAAPPDEAAARRRELEAHRDVLLDQLRELDDTALGRDPQELARQRDALELEAAGVLAALDRDGGAKRAAKASAAPAPAVVVTAHAGRRGFLWGAGTVAAVAALVIWVSGAARPRAEGEGVTGTVGGPTSRGDAAGAPPAAAPDPEAARLEQQIARNPDDIEARLGLTRILLGRRELMQVWEQTQQVLARSPGHPRALSYQALVRLAMGQAEAAETMLKQAMAAAPDLLEPRLHLSLVYMQTGRVAQADAVLDEAKRRFPDEAEGLDRLRAEMKAQASSEPASAFEGHPEVPGSTAVPAPAPAPARASADHVSGSIEMEGGRAAPAGGIVFLTARAVGQTEGPPLAVKRLPASFPLSFTLGREDSMMGEPLPGELRLEVRLDADGDPLTRSAQDPSARLDAVRLGQDGLRLRLR
jgi:tetratricopeptide (TPR) repeat protein